MAVACSGDGNTIFSGGTNRRVSVWDATTGEQLSTLTGHDATVNGLALSADDAHLMSASEDSTLLVWSTPQ